MSFDILVQLELMHRTAAKPTLWPTLMVLYFSLFWGVYFHQEGVVLGFSNFACAPLNISTPS